MQPFDPSSQPIHTPSVAPDGYISAVDAAARFGLTNDHIASLCRKGKVEGMLVGRSRYVSAASLEAYMREAELERAARKAALSSKLKQEYHERAPAAPAALVETPAAPQQGVKSPFISHEPHVYGLAFAVGLFFVGAGYASGAWGGTALQAAAAQAVSAQRNVASGIVAVAELYPRKADQVQWEALMPEAAEEKDFTKQHEGAGALADAGSQTAALGNTFFMAAAIVSRPPTLPAAPEIQAYASAKNYSGILQNTGVDKIISPASALISLPYIFITENLTQFGSEAVAVYRGIAYATDVLADAQNSAYADFVTAAQEARDAYVASLVQFSSQSRAITDSAAAAYGQVSIAFVQGTNDTASSQAQAYVMLGSAIGIAGNESVAYGRAVADGAQLMADTAGSLPVPASRVAASVTSFENSLASGYASALGKIGEAFVQGVNAASDAYAAAVGSASAAFVRGTDAAAGKYAAAAAAVGKAVVGGADATASATMAAASSIAEHAAKTPQAAAAGATQPNMFVIYPTRPPDADSAPFHDPSPLTSHPSDAQLPSDTLPAGTP